MTREKWLAAGAAAFLVGLGALFAFHREAFTVPALSRGFSALGAVTDADLGKSQTPSFATTSPAAATRQQAAQLLPAAQASSTVSTAALDATVGLVRGALVNIICEPSASNLNAASATGVVIDPRGVILTVAHMAQYFLLANYPRTGGTQCVIRTGSPAQDSYTASLIYISPDWVQDNPSTLLETQPTGTGQDDFALLAITGSATATPLPSSFIAIPLSTEDPAVQEPVTIGSYGAEFLDSAQISSSLYPIVVFGSIADRYTFSSSTEDLVSITNTAAAQEGSSGGVVVNAEDQTIGLITTSSVGASVTDRTLHAITGDYIERTFLAETGVSLATYLETPLPTLVKDFKSESAGLTGYLEDHLQ